MGGAHWRGARGGLPPLKLLLAWRGLAGLEERGGERERETAKGRRAAAAMKGEAKVGRSPGACETGAPVEAGCGCAGPSMLRLACRSLGEGRSLQGAGVTQPLWGWPSSQPLHCGLPLAGLHAACCVSRARRRCRSSMRAQQAARAAESTATATACQLATTPAAAAAAAAASVPLAAEQAPCRQERGRHSILGWLMGGGPWEVRPSSTAPLGAPERLQGAGPAGQGGQADKFCAGGLPPASKRISVGRGDVGGFGGKGGRRVLGLRARCRHYHPPEATPGLPHG